MEKHINTALVPMHEFLLWNNCNNNCSFCYQKEYGIGGDNPNDFTLSSLEKQKSISEYKALLQSIIERESVFDLLLVGGELFPIETDVKSGFFNLVDEIHNYIIQGKIRYLYLNTNLLYDDTQDLTTLLDKLCDYHENLKFTTSFDFAGRFHTSSQKILFLQNLLYISSTYPKLHIVCNTIITTGLFSAIKNNNNVLLEMENKYNIEIFLLPYNPYCKALELSDKQILELLFMLTERDKARLFNCMQNLQLNQLRKLYKYSRIKNEIVHIPAKYNNCSHPSAWAMFSDECILCKWIRIKNQFQSTDII